MREGGGKRERERKREGEVDVEKGERRWRESRRE